MCSSSTLGGGAYRRERREEQTRDAALPGTGRPSAERRLEEGDRYACLQYMNHTRMRTRRELTWRCVAGSKSGEYEELRERVYTKLLSNGSLLLQNVKEDREGFYLCQAHNGIGTGIGKVVQVKVNCKFQTFQTKFVSCLVTLSASVTSPLMYKA